MELKSSIVSSVPQARLGSLQANPTRGTVHPVTTSLTNLLLVLRTPVRSRTGTIGENVRSVSRDTLLIQAQESARDVTISQEHLGALSARLTGTSASPVSMGLSSTLSNSVRCPSA